MKKDDNVYLKHILDAINQIQEYTHGINHDEFVSKKMVQDAVIRQIEIIGEATKQLSQEILKKYNSVIRSIDETMIELKLRGYKEMGNVYYNAENIDSAIVANKKLLQW